MKPSRRSKEVASLLMVTVSVVGLMVFAYSACVLALRPINFDWLLLALVTILMVSRIDIGITEAGSPVTLSETFIFISVLLYGTHAAVVLAGLEAAARTLQFKDRRRMALFNAAAMSISIFVSSVAVSLTFGEVQPLNPDLVRLLLAAGMLALIHFALNSTMTGFAEALSATRSIIDTWKKSLLWTSVSVMTGAVSACLIVKLITVVSFYGFIISVP